jgi:hypothetical protein
MTFDLNRMRVAKPCSMTWESLGDDERVRSCDLCRHNVYNTAGITRGEIAALVATREGRLCVRLYRRADGTLMTADCPVGVKSYARRVGRLASAAAAILFGLAGVSFGQKAAKADKKGDIKITVAQVQDAAGVRGVVMDMNGAVIPDAVVDIYANGIDEKRGKAVKPAAALRTDDRGAFAADGLGEGIFTAAVRPSFIQKAAYYQFTVKKGTVVDLHIYFAFPDPEHTIVVGELVMEPAMIDVTLSTVQTIVPHKIRIP